MGLSLNPPPLRHLLRPLIFVRWFFMRVNQCRRSGADVGNGHRKSASKQYNYVRRENARETARKHPTFIQIKEVDKELHLGKGKVAVLHLRTYLARVAFEPIYLPLIASYLYSFILSKLPNYASLFSVWLNAPAAALRFSRISAH